ncbi:hypothetical protein PINS_up012369 [Pythium insidiosum]|nr:hypothetical protein PINS_up012369 [Pythium insidiosum]
MVDLNLNPTQKPKTSSFKNHQTLEQARQSSFKEKVPVMPLPTATPVAMTPAPIVPALYGATTMGAGAYFPQQQGMVSMTPTHPGQYNTVGGYGYNMGGPPSTVNSAMAAYAGAAPIGTMYAKPQQPYMTTVAPQQSAYMNSDPFATLS